MANNRLELLQAAATVVAAKIGKGFIAKADASGPGLQEQIKSACRDLVAAADALNKEDAFVQAME
jgi:hypothetical protein